MTFQRKLGQKQLRTGAALAALLAAMPAFAQDAPAADPPAAESQAEDDGLTTITVTARRRTENLQEVPLSVTAFTAKDLTERRITSKTDLADFTPSLLTITGGYPKEVAFFALRGQGPAFGSTPGVVSYFAEVPNTIPIDGRTGTYYDMANIQVLAGPQGTLFGKNATGGNILFEPARPTDKFEGYVQAEYGNYNDRRVEGAINVPIADDKVMLRVAGEAGRRDGYTIDVGPVFKGKDYDNLRYEGFRASLTIRPVEGVELYTVGRYYYSNNNGPGTVLTDFNPNAAAIVDPSLPAFPVLAFFPGMATAVAEQNARGPRRVAYGGAEYSKTTFWQIVNHATVELGDNLKLKNIVSYAHYRNRYGYDYDATINPIAGQSSPSGNPTVGPNTLTEELQLQGDLADKALSFTLGGYYDRQRADRAGGEFTQFPFSVLLGGPITGILANRNSSKAVFGQATLDLGKVTSLTGLSLTGGYRYTWEKNASFTTIVPLPTVGGEGKFQYGSYTFTVDYDLNRKVHAYFTTRDAYKAGGVNGPVPAGSAFRLFPPEKLQDFEIGLKSEFNIGGAAGRFNFAAYRGDYTNIQRTTAEIVSGALLNVTRSAAKGRIQGVEMTGMLVPARGLTLNASYSYIDAKYTKVVDASAQAILQGAPFPFTPKHKFTLGASWENDLGSIGTLALSANYAHQSKFSTAQTNASVVDYLPGYGTLNLRAELRGVGGSPVDVAAFMTNAADKDYATGLFDAYNQPFGFVTYTYSEPRMYGVQLRYSFGN